MATRRYPDRAGPIPNGAAVVVATHPDDCWARSAAECAAAVASGDLPGVPAVPAGSEEYPMGAPYW